MKSDEELIQTFKLFVDENDIINLVCFKLEKEAQDNGRVMELVRDGLFKIFDGNPQKIYNFFVDLLSVGKIMGAEGFSSQTRKIGAQVSANKQLNKAALVTSSIIVKTIANFIISAAGKNQKMKVFSDKEEALKWLKEE
jgi:hypothetical protein